MATATPIRVGAVSFVNTVPLIHTLQAAGEPSIVLTLAPPARLADLMHAGAVDVGLIPVVEHFRAGNYRLLTSVGICSRGPVDTVTLYCRKPAAEVASIAADVRSRTSVALTRVWFDKALGRRPEVSPTDNALAGATAGLGTPCPRDDVPPGQGVAPGATNVGRSDAVLVIGEDNWKVPRAGWAEIIDLGAAWTTLTGLGFVYAGWSARPELPADVAAALERRLTAAKEAGVAAVRELSARAAPAAGVSAAKVEEYLTRNIGFDIGEPEREGMELFAKWCAELSLL